MSRARPPEAAQHRSAQHGGTPVNAHVQHLPARIDCDLVVVGSGAGGLSTAITARKAGLDVVVLEKADVFGGTTAFSGGVLWIPGNATTGVPDSRAAVETYLRHETGAFHDDAAVKAFLDHAPAMVAFFERETSVAFVPTLYPDYHPDAPGGVDVGRSILAKPFDIRGLGKDMARLRPPLQTITFIGMMFNSSNADLKHFFQATKSLQSFVYVAKRLAVHLKELALYRRGIQVTSGNALAARLAKSALDLAIPIHTGTAARELLTEGARVVGVRAEGAGGELRVHARRGVVLASGGFSHDVARLRQAYPHVARGGEHLSPVPESNTGDGARLAEAAGAAPVQARYPQPAAWMPISKVPLGGGRFGVFPHLLDRYKPGVIGVTRQGRRFTNESNSYHDVGAAMVQACRGERETAMWLVCDQATMAKYGLGYAKPAPIPLGGLIKSGYLLKGRTLAELAGKAGIDAAALQATVAEYNQGAVHGEDRQFGRGTTSFNRYLADAAHQPNPCVAPVGAGPYYAVKVLMGDLGTFDGIRTSVVGEVLDTQGGAIAGLYAVGNDRASIMGGNYPGAGITLGPIMTFGYLTGRHIAGLQTVPDAVPAAAEVRHAA
jgi:succinate dehydrogenase/fumarate reductase flavoprotein subunit